MTTKRNILEAMERLSRKEQAFLSSEFLSPVVAGGVVCVRLAGVSCRMRMRPAAFTGWGVFRPLSLHEAELVRTASMTQRRSYLALFPAVRLVVARQQRQRLHAIPLNPGESNLAIEGCVEVNLAEEVELFEIILARFDGERFWFDEPEMRTDPAAATALRQALDKMIEPNKLDRPGLMLGQRLAYLLNYRARLAALVEDERTIAERRLRDALIHAGAELRDFAEKRDEYRVTFRVNGRQHTSMIRKNDLTVRSAGICLSGRDQNFDLNSLVGVLREAGRLGRPM